MRHPPFTELDLRSAGRVWSLRSAELRYSDPQGRPDHHSLVLLLDQPPDSPHHILDELHFLPMDGEQSGTSHSSLKDDEATRPNRKFLGAAAYRKPQRDLGTLANHVYLEGPPLTVLNAWNLSLRIALKIAALKIHFQVDDCRVAARATIESLGFAFHTFPELALRPGTDRHIASAIGQHPLGLVPEAPKAFQQFLFLRQRLEPSHRPQPARVASDRSDLG